MESTRKLTRERIAKALSNNILYLILGLILVVVVIAEPRFLSMSNIMNILKQSSTKGIIGLGMAGIILVAGNDLSAGRTLGLCAVISASLLQSVTYSQRYYPQIEVGLPLIVPLLICVFVALIIALVNGLLVAKFHLPAFIATLGTQLIVYGINCIYLEAQPLGSSQPLSTFDTRYTALVNNSVKIFNIRVSYLILYFIVLALIVGFIWNRTKLGKNMYAVGGNPEAAAVSGVNVPLTIILAYLLGGLMIGIGSFLEAARIQSVNTSTGYGYELDAISACVIGGTSLSGGIGKVRGVVLGTIILQTINYSLYFLGVNAYLQYIIRGAIIIIAVMLDIRKTLTNQ